MPLTEEDTQAVKDLISSAITGVVGNLKKGTELAISKAIEASQTNIAKVLDEKLTALAPKPDDDTTPNGKGKKGEDRELATLRQQIADLTRKSTESEQRAAAERSKNRNTSLRNAVAEALEPHGITGARFRGAFALLQANDMVRYVADDSDDISFVDAATGEVDYRTGLAGWVKSDEAKIYLPAPGTQGAGTRPKSSNPQVKTGPTTPAERSQKILGVLGEWAENPR